MRKQPVILVIDDEPDNFDVIETLLNREDYQLSYVSNGQQALDLLNVFQPDVILLDVMMPIMDGIEFCQRFKASPLWQHIPVIMVTALTSMEDMARCLAAGADDFISKPVNRLELSARVRSMLRIKQQYDNVQNLLRLREDMVNMVIHDLRNPLATITLVADILQRPNFPAEKQLAKIKQIAVAGRELQSMIDTLLLMAKLESGKLTPNCIPVDLGTLCLSALTGFEPIAAQKKLQLSSELPRSEGSISVDLVLFRRIIDNLISNAIKFSPVNSKVHLVAEYLESGGARVQVVDEGPGVTEEMRQRIFERYEIGSLFKGVDQTGLGLAFCKIAIESQGGKIAVKDNHPKGSIFVIEV